MSDTQIRLPQEPTAGKLRADAIAIMVMGLLASCSVVSLAVGKLLGIFTSGGIAWRLQVEDTLGSAVGLPLYSSDGPPEPTLVNGTITHLEVIVPNVNTVSMVCIGASIVLAAMTALVVIASTVRLAWLFQQGRFFTMPTSFALRVFTWTLVFGGLAAFGLWQMGANGVEGALGVRASANSASEWWGWYLITLFAVTAFGLVDIALRRAIRLQHETEGLV